ncbi:Eco57I restriction-modification methylase domain-containing protein [Tardiphaga sp. 20_F10_N6_6]|uniref:Eco57I restriction-modification methylase domain-containing protein n=1 Tax=unclassified Tardiphaga TaxID=2631404 RepID=UPI003F1FC41E
MIETAKTIEVPDSCVVQTPLLLANAMIGALGNKKSDTWLEPCVGNGALLGAMSRNGVKKEAITGLDVDAKPQPNDRFGNILRGTEFLRWSRTTEQRFDKIVANPPYIALERLDAAIRKAAIDASLSEQIRITGNGNAWYAFLCASIRLLKKDGSLCFLLPAAWDYANYAVPLRELISNYFSSIDVFRTTTPIFRAENVQEGSIMLLAKGRRETSDPGIKRQNTSRYEVASIDDLIIALAPGARAKQPRTSRSVVSPAIKSPKERQPLETLISIRLGTVTGDSSYFLLNESRRKLLKLPASAVSPVLSKAKHLNSPKMTLAQWTALKDADERVWLFKPSARIVNNRFVQSYLDFGLNGGCKVENHKVSIRKPWFRCPDLPVCDAFMSGMSAAMPTLSFRAMPDLTVTNTLYAVTFLDPSISWQDRLGIAISLLQSDVRDQMRCNGRPYAAGLLKHEPCDLLKLQIPQLGSVRTNWSTYRQAIQALKNGEESECSRIADSCLR